jgi:hypothetical protein
MGLPQVSFSWAIVESGTSVGGSSEGSARWRLAI